MTRRYVLPLLFLLATGSVAAQPLPEGLPDGIVPPENLNALGERIGDRLERMIWEEVLEDTQEVDAKPQIDLFAGTEGEDPNLAEIRRIAKGLETQRSMILKLAALQSDLIAFAGTDPHAAYRSRIPVLVCEVAIAPEFCRNLNASFQ